MQGARSKVVAEHTDHTGESKMYLMGIVNSAFVGRRQTDHVELVDLSEEKKKAQERYNKAHKVGTPQSPKSSASPRCQVLENQPAHLCMEPLFPPLLTSPASVDSFDSVDAPMGATGTMQKTSRNIVEKTKKHIKDPSSRQLELGRELSEGDKHTEVKQAGGTTKTDGKTRVAPKLGRVLSDGGVPTRVQRHPLEVIPEQERSDEHVGRAKMDRPMRVLQHPLQRIDEDSPKDRKPIARKERKTVVAPSPQPGGRKFVREPKIELKHPPKRERPKPRESRVPITKPRNPKPVPPVVNDREKPSLANPVMEKMEGLASPEHSWNEKLQNLPKLAVSNEPLVEERELPYSSPKLTKSDAQDELSFRVWERDCIPKRKSISVSSDFQDLDLETLGHSVEPPKAQSLVEEIPEQLSPLQTFRATMTLKPVDVQHCQEESIQHEYPSPSSFTCGLSPTSLFSDDDNIFSRFQQFPEFGDATTNCKSPRSVLSDETSHFASDSSETGHRHPCASSSTYNDESSDLESPADGIYGRSFSTFTYTDKETELTTSEDETRDHNNANGVDDLQYFQEANHRDPWLETDGGVLDDSDLEFLLPPETPSIPNAYESEITEEIDHSTSLQNSRKPKSQITWIPCDDSTRLTRRHSRSSSKEKLHPPRPPRRSVKFAPELVQEISESTPKSNPNLKPLRLPRPESPNSKDEDERIYPSEKSWEVNEETDAPKIPPPRRRWRRAMHSSQPPRPPKSEANERVAAAPSVMSSRRRWRRCREEMDERHSVIMPCAGRLFSWPQRLAFKVSRSRHVDVSDDESIAGTESFGRSARRDAQQVRRILKGSQKRFSNLTVADILKDNFQP